MGTNRQKAVPEPPRSKHGFPPGTRAACVERDEELVPRPTKPLRELFGMLRAEPGWQSLTDALLHERQTERDREGR